MDRFTSDQGAIQKIVDTVRNLNESVSMLAGNYWSLEALHSPMKSKSNPYIEGILQMGGKISNDLDVIADYFERRKS